MTSDNVMVLYSTPAYTLTPKDQAIIDGDLVIIHKVDDDRDDIDEVFVTGENLSDPTGDTEWPLFADDEIQIWGV